mmetsp:Transcript_94428/g.197270  ORF Transcript_94428/g.197270 Transcript_94428/m.197270 type:complete len:126 (-) Transcript_94428:24-401(-)
MLANFSMRRQLLDVGRSSAKVHRCLYLSSSSSSFFLFVSSKSVALVRRKLIFSHHHHPLMGVTRTLLCYTQPSNISCSVTLNPPTSCLPTHRPREAVSTRCLYSIILTPNTTLAHPEGSEHLSAT